MIQEQFPARASLRTPMALVRNQGSVLACTAFGPISAVDTILQRAGQNVHLSTRLVWYILRGQQKGIEATIDVLRTKGTCLESLCPYDDTQLNEPPSGAAWADAERRILKDLRLVPVAGVEAVFRSIGQGSPLPFKMTNGDGSEHVSCIDGYAEDGVKVLDSIGAALTMPWADVESGGRIKQLYSLAGLPLVPHPGYVEGDLPTLVDGVLTLPKASVWCGWEAKPRSLNFKNIKLRLIDSGQMTNDDSEVRDIVFWHSAKATLYIPKLIDGDTILYNVKIVQPRAALISAEEANA